MENLKYFNEFQFISDFTTQLQTTLPKDYVMELDKRIGNKQMDLFIENTITGHTYTIEVKGSSEKENLPPEIIPWLKKLKGSIDVENNHFVVFSLSHVNDNVKEEFFKNNIGIFEYENHKNNTVKSFVDYINKLEANFLKTLIDRKLLELKRGTPYQLFVKGGVNSDKVEISFRYSKLQMPLFITVGFADADGRRMQTPVELPKSGFKKYIPGFDDFLPSYNFGFIEIISPIDLNIEISIEEDDTKFY